MKKKGGGHLELAFASEKFERQCRNSKYAKKLFGIKKMSKHYE